MTTKNFKVKNGIDIGNVADAIKVSGGVIQTKGGNIQIGITGANEIDTSSGNLTIDSAGGTVTVDDNFQIGSGASVSTILDEDNMATDSDTALATQQSIKAYVDGEIGNLSSTTIQEGNSSVVVADSGTGAVTVTLDGSSELVMNTTTATFTSKVVGNEGFTGQNVQVGVTAAGEIDTSTGNLTIDSAGGTTTIDDTLSVTGNVVIDGDLTVQGTETVINSNSLQIEDNQIVLARNNSSDAIDVGFFAHTYPGGFDSAVPNHTGIFRDATNAEWYLIATYSKNEDQTTIDRTDPSFGLATLNAAAVNATTFTGNLTGTATAAQYSDLAERFAADTVYEPGTVVALGGAEEITATQEERSERVFGVVSGEHQAAFKMNGAAGTNETHPYIAMAGRVQVKVLGAISKGDRLVTSIVPGVARRAERDECTAFNVIGRALENKHTDGLGEVLCFVTAKS